MRNRIYISARFDRREEMKEVSKAVQALGYDDVSHWIVQEQGANPSETVLRDKAALYTLLRCMLYNSVEDFQ